MSKRISQESLQNIIDEYANDTSLVVKSNQKSNKKGTKIKKNIILIIAIISILINAILGSLLILNHSHKNYKNEYTKCNSKLNKLETERYNYKLDSDNLEILLNGNPYYYISQKLDFIDKNIVFVIEGYGNYYYSYDCMKNKVGNNAFSYWAYNKEAAADRGYIEGSCN